MEETVTITKKEYERLQKSEDILEGLRAVGLDNWHGYDDAMAMHYELFPDEE